MRERRRGGAAPQHSDFRLSRKRTARDIGGGAGEHGPAIHLVGEDQPQARRAARASLGRFARHRTREPLLPQVVRVVPRRTIGMAGIGLLTPEQVHTSALHSGQVGPLNGGSSRGEAQTGTGAQMGHSSPLTLGHHERKRLPRWLRRRAPTRIRGRESAASRSNRKRRSMASSIRGNTPDPFQQAAIR